MQILPPGYSMESLAMSDVPRLTQFANTYARRWSGRDMITEEQLQIVLSAPGLDLATSARLVPDPDNALATTDLVFHRDPPRDDSRVGARRQGVPGARDRPMPE